MYHRFQLILELNKMLELFNNSYKFRMLRLTLESLEKEDNSHILFELVKALNSVNKLFLNDLWVNEEFKPLDNKKVIDNAFNCYMEFLNRYTFVIGNIPQVFKDYYRLDCQQQLLIHWNKSITGYDDNEKPFIDVFDDMHRNAIIKHQKLFTLRLENMKHLYRAQRGQHLGNYIRMIPTIEHAKNKNRWNPEGVAFQYLGFSEQILPYDKVISLIIKGCCEEIRLISGEYVSTCKFRLENNNAKIINFCYEDIEYDSQELEINQYIELSSQREVKRILSKKIYTEQLKYLYNTKNIEDSIWKIINKEVKKDDNRKALRKHAEIFIAKLIMKSIDEAVFLPVDNNDDPDLKAYIPFHLLANYLISKGYNGIVYRSTRMNRIGLNGKNLVLFNTEDASPIKGSMAVYFYDGENYCKVEDNN